MTTTAMTTVQNNPTAVALADQWTREKLDLLKRTVAAGTSNDEFDLFCEVARSSGLNPFQRQIYAIMRQESYKDERGNWQKRQKMTIQTGIDGYRLIAARTGLHAGTSDAVYGPKDANGYPEWATVVVRKILPNGAIAEFTATARWAEYVQTNKEGKPSGQWPKMPFLMLGKCAEALALRKSFPAELSGVYTSEEMSQAESVGTYAATPTVDTRTGEVIDHPAASPVESKLTKAQGAKIAILWQEKFGDVVKDADATQAARAHLKAWTEKDSRSELTIKEASDYIEHLQNLPNYTAITAITVVDAEVVEPAVNVEEAPF